MLKEKFESLKSLILRKDNGNNKRKIENLIVFLIILVITVISINIIWNKRGAVKGVLAESNFYFIESQFLCSLPIFS